jgi:DNA-binding PadR family transcriptional regulator
MTERPADRPLLPGEYAVLGLLALAPRHGYDLARVLAIDLGAVCPVEQSLLYAYLRNLEARGLVEWEEVRTGRRPPRKIYAPSEDGWAAFRAWVHLPVERMREVRQDLLLKIYFLRALAPGAEQGLLQRQVDACERYARREAEALAMLAPDDDFPRLGAEARLSAANATL